MKAASDRDDLTTCFQLISKGCEYLHSQSVLIYLYILHGRFRYVIHMSEIVDRNRQIAERGGIPGTASLVAAYLKISPDHPEAEDGIHEGMPIWEVINVFYCCII